MSILQDKLRSIADRIDPRIEGIAIVIVGDVQYELACVVSNDHERDAMTLAMCIEQAARTGATKPRKGFDTGDNEDQ